MVLELGPTGVLNEKEEGGEGGRRGREEREGGGGKLEYAVNISRHEDLVMLRACHVINPTLSITSCDLHVIYMHVM